MEVMRVNLIRVQLYTNADLFSENDPYVEIRSDQLNWRSSVKDEAGKQAEWHGEYCDVRVEALEEQVL